MPSIQEGEGETGANCYVWSRGLYIQDYQLRAQGLKECRAGEIPG